MSASPRASAAVGVAARVQHDTEQAERFGAIELVGHRVDRLPAKPGFAVARLMR